MTCKGILASMTDYLEGDVDKNVCTEIEKHLDGCLKCRMHVDTMRAVITLYKGWRADPIPDDVSTRLHKALAKTVQSSSRSSQRKGKSVEVRKKRGLGPSKRKKS